MKKLKFLIILIFGFFGLCFADESITMTTYYPSPYGSYNQLDVSRSVTFKPQSNLAAIQALSSPQIGEVAYSSGDDKFYYNNTGTSGGWVALSGGSGGGVTMMSARSASTYNHAGACAYCYNLSAAAAYAMNGDTTNTYTDWRLPSASEAAVFEGTITATDTVWTSTSGQAGYGGYWYGIKLSDGSGSFNNYDYASYYARCVR